MGCSCPVLVLQAPREAIGNRAPRTAPQPSQVHRQAGASTPLHAYHNAADFVAFRDDGYRLSVTCGAHGQAC
jgi:hypothetical protein